MNRWWLLGVLALVPVASLAQEKKSASLPLPTEIPKNSKKPEQPVFPTPATLLKDNIHPLLLEDALRLAGIQNPELQVARNRVDQALALRQLAAAQLLPNLNLGGNLHHHLGTLQQSNGNIIEVNRDSLYLGMGAGAVGGGTVTIPGLVWSGNLSETYFTILFRRQLLAQAEFNSLAVENQVLLRTAGAYLDLLRAGMRQAIAVQIREDAREVARITANYAKTGQGRQADAHRAATEFEQRNLEVVQAENDMQLASARLTQLLNLDPAVRLVPVEDRVLPESLIPPQAPLSELLAVALVQRPEMRERQAAVQGALLQLKAAKALPFSPNVILGYSAGTFGGGGNLFPDQPRFGNFGDRTDFDAIFYWSAQNLGVGNVAQIRIAKSQLQQNHWREIETLNRIGAEVAAAYSRTFARFTQIEVGRRSVETSVQAFQEDLIRTRNREGLPIEVLDSLRLLGRSRYAFLDAIIDYNRAQYELFVSLGKPPAPLLARSLPAELVPAPQADLPKK